MNAVQTDMNRYEPVQMQQRAYIDTLEFHTNVSSIEKDV